MLDGDATTMRHITTDDLKAIHDRGSLFSFLNNVLNWPTDAEDPFTYEIKVINAPSVKADVTQIVPFTGADAYRIYLVESDQPIRRRDLRESLRLVRAHMRQTGQAADMTSDRFLFVCSGRSYDEIRFVRFTQQDGRQPRICSFGWERDRVEETRTVREMCLPCLRLDRDLFDNIAWGAARWDAAWDVEAVTAEFYRDYRVLFDELKQKANSRFRDEGRAHLLVQRLLHRLMFCWFLQRKGWLNHNQQYLRELWQSAMDNAHTRTGQPARSSYYRDYLIPLFTKALNTPEARRSTDPEWCSNLNELGRVPFLNGGLFAPDPDLDTADKVPLSNADFDRVLKLFEGYHFTVSESTPDDVEVALDPELLGKVYERLAVERHDTGSYYTPRAIVAFMCREALALYLRDYASEEAVARFVQDSDASGLPDPEGVLARLKAIRVCDPACGSGAYLVGMMHELLRLREALFVARVRDHATTHDRKLEIVQRNLYGADLSQPALETAMLRLWLSLVVDDLRDPVADPNVDVSLPNLKFKFAQGDTVVGYIDSGDAGKVGREQYADLAERLRILHDEYFAPARDDSRPRPEIEADITAQEHSLRDLLGTTEIPGSVSWNTRFAEVFAPQAGEQATRRGGFDVVITNPPYVRQEKLARPYREVVGLPPWDPQQGRDRYGAPYKQYPKKVHPDVGSGTADLYVYFYSRAVQLLKPGGILAFISSNKWFRAKYGEKLRAYLAARCQTLSITDFGELPVFEAGTFPMIYIARKKTEDEQKADLPSEPVFTQVKSLDAPYPDIAALIAQDGQKLPPSAINRDVWILTGSAEIARIKKMEQAGVPLGTYVQNRIYYGIKTGFNEAFIIDERKRDELIAADPASAEIIKPLAVGDDIRRWHIRDRKRWLIVTKIGVDMGRYPAVFAHLKQYQAQLEKRWDRGEQWWELRACAYYDVFEREKIVYPEIAKEPRFTLDHRGIFPIKTCFSIPGSDLFLLALLNSGSAWWYLKSPACCSVLGDENRGGRLTLQEVFVSRLPIPDASDAERSRLADLARKCLDAQGQGCEEWEPEIDEIVAGLYGL
jgi:type I restriction-modification system DNA methylase subunit